ncbi:hypothetical protein [Nonomuraea dietziae]|uniref:hypothetical protein n=1 Tax=Nonomuraea dietziae TaxID=65515 RepID=UPI0031CE0202
MGEGGGRARAHRGNSHMWRLRHDLGDDGAVPVLTEGRLDRGGERPPADAGGAPWRGVNAVLRR